MQERNVPLQPPEDLLGVPVHPITAADAVRAVSAWITDRKRPAAVVVQTNVLSLVTAQEDADYRSVVSGADLSLPDGMPLVWMLRRRGKMIPDRVYGPDLMGELAEQGSRSGWRVFLYGGASGVPEKVASVLVRRFPGLKVVGTYSPPFRPLTASEEKDICTMINTSKADLLWAALGGPAQDRWMVAHRETLDVSVMHGVGAAFDFLAGRVPQAPRWMMNAGLEWLFRLLAEPRRLWKRYTIKNLKFCYYVLTRPLKPETGEEPT